MKTQQIRVALKQLHTTRGALATLCNQNGLNYPTLFKFMCKEGRQLEHDTALAVINALPTNLKQQVQEAA